MINEYKMIKLCLEAYFMSINDVTAMLCEIYYMCVMLLTIIRSGYLYHICFPLSYMLSTGVLFV